MGRVKEIILPAPSSVIMRVNDFHLTTSVPCLVLAKTFHPPAARHLVLYDPPLSSPLSTDDFLYPAGRV